MVMKIVALAAIFFSWSRVSLQAPAGSSEKLHLLGIQSHLGPSYDSDPLLFTTPGGGPSQVYGNHRARQEASSLSKLTRRKGKEIAPSPEELSTYSVQQLITKRPRYLRGKAAELWEAAFDTHPDIIALDPSSSVAQMELDIRKLRAIPAEIEEDEGARKSFNQRLTIELKRNFDRRNIPNAYTKMVMHRWADRRAAIAQEHFVAGIKQVVDQQTHQRYKGFIDRRVTVRQRYNMKMKEGDPEGEAERILILEELLGAGLQRNLTIEEMEAGVAIVLNKHAESSNSRKALQIFLDVDGYSEDYADAVATLRRANRLRASNARRKRESRQRAREAAGVQAGTSLPTPGPSSAIQHLPTSFVPPAHENLSQASNVYTQGHAPPLLPLSPAAGQMSEEHATANWLPIDWWKDVYHF